MSLDDGLRELCAISLHPIMCDALVVLEKRDGNFSKKKKIDNSLEFFASKIRT